MVIQNKQINKKCFDERFLLFIILGFALNLFFASTAFAASPTLNLSLSSGTVSLELVALDNAGTFASSNNLIIYGQSVGNGTLTASAPWNGINTNNSLTINC